MRCLPQLPVGTFNYFIPDLAIPQDWPVLNTIKDVIGLPSHFHLFISSRQTFNHCSQGGSNYLIFASARNIKCSAIVIIWKSSQIERETTSGKDTNSKPKGWCSNYKPIVIWTIKCAMVKMVVISSIVNTVRGMRYPADKCPSGRHPLVAPFRIPVMPLVTLGISR